MNKYIVLSSHNVYEDSYTEGEVTWVNGYDLEMKVSAKDPKDAIERFYKKNFYKEFDPVEVDLHEGRIYDSFMVDGEGLMANENDIEKWKRGEGKLYADNFTVFVYILQEVNLEEIF